MTTFSVPEMSCGHCKASVEAALAPISATVRVDLEQRRVTTEGAEAAAVISALAAIGFPAQPLG
ncbi:cation transporter [Xinfangfangia sp. CPCC 101601]|uniref:Cation transporter n=1 Tax=Pseudogemmobacter lacusdianii TaxID=3069608 RepID=A0ABU0VV31_9RHOB|nr:cation transporter [Xinfangfangia sp. CPCC 101601]MDQ2065597.1 cation transporter [Xinfangfangia sp. CPCC 101601]